ncbi:uncharacterized protein LOC120340133 [Styela clava]
MRLKVAAILVVAISLLLAEESYGGWGGFFRGAKRVVKRVVKGYKYARRTKLGHIAIELGKKALKKKLGLDEEITKLRKLREKDEEVYIHAMSLIADEIAAESGDGEAQIMVEMLDELARMPDEEFDQFVAEQELEQIADSDELLLSDH